MNRLARQCMTLVASALIGAGGWAIGAPGNGGASNDTQPGTVMPAAGAVGKAAPANGAVVTQDLDESRVQRLSPRYTLRLGLDDRRYRGFHQHSAEDLRADDRVIIENDRIQQQRRALREDTYR